MPVPTMNEGKDSSGERRKIIERDNSTNHGTESKVKRKRKKSGRAVSGEGDRHRQKNAVDSGHTARIKKWRTLKKTQRRGNDDTKGTKKAKKRDQNKRNKRHYSEAKADRAKRVLSSGNVSKKYKSNKKEKNRYKKRRKHVDKIKEAKNKMTPPNNMTKENKRPTNNVKKIKKLIQKENRGGLRNEKEKAKELRKIKQHQRKLKNKQKENHKKNQHAIEGGNASSDIRKEQSSLSVKNLNKIDSKKVASKGTHYTHKKKKRKCHVNKKCVKAGGKCTKWGKCKTKVIPGKCGKSKSCECCRQKAKKGE